MNESSTHLVGFAWELNTGNLQCLAPGTSLSCCCCPVSSLSPPTSKEDSVSSSFWSWGVLSCQGSFCELFLCERREGPWGREEEPGLNAEGQVFHGILKNEMQDSSGVWAKRIGERKKNRFSKTNPSCGSKNMNMNLSSFLITFWLLRLFLWSGHCSESRPCGDSFVGVCYTLWTKTKAQNYRYSLILFVYAFA